MCVYNIVYSLSSTKQALRLHLKGLKVSSQVIEDIKAQSNTSLKHLFFFPGFIIQIFKELGEFQILNNENILGNVQTYKERVILQFQAI